jgi:phage repressor protein C with HTH and peptisase S24 domain
MDCIYPVNGDSMEPEFHSGDYVMVQRLTDSSELAYGEIGAFAFHNETYIKEYSRIGLRSLNKKYKVMRFNDDDNVFIIGRVLGVLPAEAIVDFETAKRYERIRKAMEEAEEY